jgi:hypothetical protein
MSAEGVRKCTFCRVVTKEEEEATLVLASCVLVGVGLAVTSRDNGDDVPEDDLV